MTAIQLQRAIVEDLTEVLSGVVYKTTYISSPEEIESLRPDGEEADWSDADKAFWAELQNDYRQHHMAGVNVFPQYIPIRETSSPEPPEPAEDEDDIDPPAPPQDPDTDADPFPFVIVRLDSGDVEAPDAPHRVRILCLVGIYDDNPANQGHISVMDIIDRIQQHYLEYPRLGDFSFTDPFKWVLQDEESYPYFYGSCELNFIGRAPRTQQWEDLT